jgi:tRNA U34 5-methylaminomethyl-2-thiouridine-forming methyltransferase MnmC
MIEPELIITSDGSHSLRSEAFQVAYHSVHGAIQESQHVFMQAGFQACLDRGLTSIHVLEMGFGTGLNAYLALLKATEIPELSVSYLTIEQFPITDELVRQLNYPHELGYPNDQRFPELHNCDWDAEIRITDNFTLRKIKGDLLSTELILPLNWADTVFYDAFAPESQPQLWEEPALQKIEAAMAKGSNLVTYCAKGVVKRRFKSLGMNVESLPGPPRKREMTRAIKK